MAETIFRQNHIGCQTSRVNHVMSHVTVVTLLGEGGYDGTDRCALKVLLGFVIYANV